MPLIKGLNEIKRGSRVGRPYNGAEQTWAVPSRGAGSRC